MPDDCRQLASDVAFLRQQIAMWSNMMRHSFGEQKAFVGSRIQALSLELAKKQHELHVCLGVPKPILPLTTSFAGTASLTTADARFPGSFGSPIAATLEFFNQRTLVAVDSFSDISTSVNTPIGQSTGHMTVSLTFKIHHTLRFPFASDSDAPITLSTGIGSGIPLSKADGTIVLVGSSTFNGGTLGGIGFSLVLTGTISPLPFP